MLHRPEYIRLALAGAGRLGIGLGLRGSIKRHVENFRQV
jgi:hypothetical protein